MAATALPYDLADWVAGLNNVFALDALFPSLAAWLPSVQFSCLPSSRSGGLDGTNTAKRGFAALLHKNVRAGEWTFSAAF